ncbi:MAG: exo-alpha-sialidase [Pirellulaceae bacterium]|nr:exo-alpha-sialidase [Pirellulaceae bacterium]
MMKYQICILTVFCSLAIGSAVAERPKVRAEVLEVSKIWDNARHNAFTDLVRHNEKWFCVFREGSAHVSPDGALRVLQSDDAKNWTSAALIEYPSGDLRDAKITVTPDGRLMLSGAVAVNQPADYKHQSLTWFSDDGIHWSDAHEVGDRDFWLWRTTWHKDTAYGIGYATGSGPRSVRLYQSDDGMNYETLVENLFDEGYPNETSLVFTGDDKAYCLLRRDGGTKTGQLGISQPPYRQWDWKDLETRIGGPQMIQLPTGEMIAVVRLYDGGARTSICQVDPTLGTMTELTKLPSGGDTSYAGVVWHDGLLWVSYYSGHQNNGTTTKTAIYFAKVRIQSAAP